MNDPVQAQAQAPAVKLTAQQNTDDITRPLFIKPPLVWHGAFAAMQAMAGLLVIAIATYIVEGYGVFGTNQPVNWGNDITTYIFWIGIAVAGTLVSSILFLFRQKWRTAINRSTAASVCSSAKSFTTNTASTSSGTT